MHLNPTTRSGRYPPPGVLLTARTEEAGVDGHFPHSLGVPKIKQPYNSSE
jgi:hypothetical protein